MIIFKSLGHKTLRKHADFAKKCTLSGVMATHADMYKVISNMKKLYHR